MKLPYHLQRLGRQPTKKEKRITAKSLQDYFSLSRSKARSQERKEFGYDVSYGYYGTVKTRSRLSKGAAQGIYYNRLRDVMKMMDKRK